jgi:hypothetical protein
MLHTIRVLAFVRQAACGHGFDRFLSYRIKSSGSDQNQDKHEHLVVCTEEFHWSTNWLCKIGSNHKLLLRNASLPSLICKPILRTISFSCSQPFHFENHLIDSNIQDAVFVV